MSGPKAPSNYGRLLEIKFVREGDNRRSARPENFNFPSGDRLSVIVRAVTGIGRVRRKIGRPPVRLPTIFTTGRYQRDRSSGKVEPPLTGRSGTTLRV